MIPTQAVNAFPPPPGRAPCTHGRRWSGGLVTTGRPPTAKWGARGDILVANPALHRGKPGMGHRDDLSILSQRDSIPKPRVGRRNDGLPWERCRQHGPTPTGLCPAMRQPCQPGRNPLGVDIPITAFLRFRRAGFSPPRRAKARPTAKSQSSLVGRNKLAQFRPIT